MSQMLLEYDEFCMFLLNIEVFNIMTPDFLYTSENETKCTIILYKKFRNFKWQGFPLFKNFEENLYISHTMHYKSWRFKCFYILKISLVTYIFKLNSLKSATKVINLASFKEIQWQIILVWNVGLYLKECKISSKNVLFLPWKNCRQLNLLTISPRKESFPLQTLSLPVLFSFIQCLIKKREKMWTFLKKLTKRVYVRVS
jgi:hypothetical protein